MKKRYLAKILCLMLVFIMSASLLPMTANASYTYAEIETLNKILSEVTKRSRERTVELTINDMKFTGRLYNTALTDVNVWDFVEEVMKMDDIKLTFDDIDKLYKRTDKMLEVMGFSEADMKRVYGNVLTIAGAVLGGLNFAGSAGDAVTVLQIFYETITGNPGDAEKSVVENALLKIGDKVLDSVTEEGLGWTGGVGKGYGWAGAAKVMADEWVRSQAKYGQIRDGLEAGRKLQKLYSWIDNKIRAFCYQNMDKNLIQFEDAIAKKKTFALFGAQCTETWTLDMELKYKGKADTNPNHKGGYLDGNYEGTYSIWIEYDLGNLAAKLPDLVQLPEWRGKNIENQMIWVLYGDLVYQKMNYTLTDPGSWKVSRKLSGNATARYLNDNATITPTQTEDKKNADGNPAVVRASGFYTQTFPDKPPSQTYYDIKIVADVEALYLYYGNDNGDGEFIPEELRVKVPWGDNRGDNAKRVWTLKVFPRK